MKFHAILIAVLTALPLTALASTAKLVAVMPLDVSRAKGKLDSDGQDLLADALRDAAADALVGTGYTVMTADRTADEFSSHHIKAGKCDAESCQAKAARTIGLAKFIRISVRYVGGQLAASVQVLDAGSGTVAAGITGEGQTAFSLRKSLLAKNEKLFAWASPPSVAVATPVAPRPAPAATSGVPRAVWVNRLKEHLPAAICDSAYFQTCFTVSREECVSEATKSAGPCVDAEIAHIPEFLTEETGRSWGNTIGYCAGVALEYALEAHKGDDPRCGNPKAWH